jgi:excinuclease ABC subunit C
MYNAEGDIIYVGKAKNLRNRVRSYFQKHNPQHTPKVSLMVSQIADLDFVVTDNEVEALILEANLIKTLQPRFNILLRDDKKFPWIAISDEDYPRLYVTRNPQKRGKTRYFGPYISSNDMYATLNTIRRHFPLRQRRKPLFKNRPCMNYFIGTCPGPCQQKVTPEAYQDTINKVELFLRGKGTELKEQLQQEMLEASEALNFEWAAKVRDAIEAVDTVIAKQRVVTDDATVNQDVIALEAQDTMAVGIVLSIRQGKVIASASFELTLHPGDTPEEAYQAFLYQYYAQVAEEVPDTVVLQYEPEPVFGDWLTQLRHGRKVTVSIPQRGLKQELMAMAVKNAKEGLGQAKLSALSRLANDPARVLLELQESLDLPEFPARMECYDISHVGGTHTVASMVVFTNGQPDKQEYRRFKIQSVPEGTPNDFQSMAEVMTRRFAHDDWPEPDLVIIDGGKGQLSSAVEALDAIGIPHPPIISLAKKFEEVYRPGESRPVILPRDSKALFLLQQIRDEAHRFAITFHRQLRGKAATEKTALVGIPGLGQKRRHKLMAHYGSVEAIAQADVPSLARVLGVSMKQADALLTHLKRPKAAETGPHP